MSLAARIQSLARRDALTTVGLALTGAWALLLLLFWVVAPGSDGARGGVTHLVVAMGVVLPVVLVWLAVSMARSIALLRAEAEDLRRRLDRMRKALPGGADDDAEDEPADDAPEHAPALRDRTEAAAPRPLPPTAPPPARPRTPGDQRQAALRFDAPGSVPVDAATLVRALNFPDGPDDHDAIEALRAALKDHENSRVLRAAQDVVTLLAGRDIYMDMLPPSPAPAAVWRRFADGQRGSAVAALGGIDDDATLDVVAEMLRQDEIFRDTAHHFLRHFDGLLTRLVPELDDTQIAVLADSRSARAFMVLGRLAGSFG
ncbi:MAG: hypothetical protein ACK41U_07885 [Paracoccus sp. (in: a-proteobacteria)]|uniref:hypothetical protein n=1 Tax=Paracoccus sp. TaxID=267 RepID=UPI00391D0B20